MLGTNPQQCGGLAVARRPDLHAILVRGAPDGIALTLGRLAGTVPEIGAWERRGALWWGRPAAGRLCVAGDAGALAGAIGRLRTARRSWPAAWLALEQDALVAIGVRGPSTRRLIAALDGSPALWLVPAPDRAVGFVAPDRLAELERCIAVAGRPLAGGGRPA